MSKREIWSRISFKRPPKKRPFASSQELWEKANEYFDWNRENGIKEVKLVPRRAGRPFREMITHPRAMTIEALCCWLTIRTKYWRELKENDEFATAVEAIEAVIYTQKLELAAAGMLNAIIISRELKLADRSELSGPDGGPLEMVSDDAERFSRRIAGLAARGGKG